MLKIERISNQVEGADKESLDKIIEEIKNSDNLSEQTEDILEQ